MVDQTRRISNRWIKALPHIVHNQETSSHCPSLFGKFSKQPYARSDINDFHHQMEKKFHEKTGYMSLKKKTFDMAEENGDLNLLPSFMQDEDDHSTLLLLLTSLPG